MRWAVVFEWWKHCKDGETNAKDEPCSSMPSTAPLPLSSWSLQQIVCSMLKRSGWSTVRSALLAKEGTSKKRPSLHLHKVPTWSNKESPWTFQTALVFGVFKIKMTWGGEWLHKLRTKFWFRSFENSKLPNLNTHTEDNHTLLLLYSYQPRYGDTYQDTSQNKKDKQCENSIWKINIVGGLECLVLLQNKWHKLQMWKKIWKFLKSKVAEMWKENYCWLHTEIVR
jgi:hypothetical protein